MSKEKFINELRSKLRRLPKEEVDNVIAYYLDYFEDAGKDEAEVIKELDSPSTIASQILADYAFSPDTEEKKTSSLNKISLIVLSIFAAPIALPLAFAFVMVLFAMLIVVVALIFSFGAVAVALFASGIAAFVAGILVFFQGPATGIFYIGAGLIVIALGIFAGIGIKALVPNVFSVIRNMTTSFLSKFNKSKLNSRGNF
ncbi:MAG: DUF1700 domain-containing protein [Clostridium sp.]